MLQRITYMDASPVTTQRRQLAHIVARESAETLVGRRAGLRGEGVPRLIRTAGGLVDDGREHVAGHGPLLIVANHPGLSDAVALLAALGRDDAWIVAANYPFLRALRLASQRFLFVSDDRAGRLST